MLTIFSEEIEGVSDLPKRMQTFGGQRTELDALGELSVDYLYDGAKNPFNGSKFNISAIQQAADVQTIYQHGGVSIYKLCD